VPGREEEFRAGVASAISYAARLKTVRVHAMAGIAPQGASPEALRATYIANLKYAAAELARHGITLLIEAINTRDMPGFYLNTQAQSHAFLEEVGAPNLKMQMDLYHMQIMEGDLEVKLRKYAAQCGHVQVAGVPKRNEPDTGEVRYSHLFGVLDEIGYQGWVGCEYRPAGKTVDGLGWFQRLGKSTASA
jgi:hydroxypyruvate isomerase